MTTTTESESEFVGDDNFDDETENGAIVPDELQDNTTMNISEWNLPQLCDAVREANHLNSNEKNLLLAYVGFLAQRLTSPFETFYSPAPARHVIINQMILNVVESMVDAHKRIVPHAFERAAKPDEDEDATEEAVSTAKTDKKTTYNALYWTTTLW